MINGVLKDADAEDNLQTGEAVKKWLEQLRVVAYDANNLLDEFSTEAQRRQLIRFPKVRKFLSLLSPKRSIFRHVMYYSAQDMIQRLDDIKGRQPTLVRDVARVENEFRPITSSIDSPPLGREKDKQSVVDFLVSSNEANKETRISVIPVFGMGGVGKTALALIVYNDEIVRDHFDLRLWVHVSINFDVNRITKEMLEAIDGRAWDTVSLGILRSHLQDRLFGKKYLLVLDGVWNGNPLGWEGLKAPLLYGAMGSKILVTTRSVAVAKVMGTVHPYHLKCLSDKNCWLLFCQRVSRPAPYQGSIEDKIYLDNMKDAILNKCSGLPLAVESIALRIRTETDRSRWRAILRDETFELTEIWSSIRLSYQQLPAKIKPCFAYCSIIPNGYVFNKELLVQLWMAQNFLGARGEETMEDVGGRYFDSLVEWSFFEFSHFDFKSNQHKYVMRAVIHDFARLVSGEECCILQTETGNPRNISEKTRHSLLFYGPMSSSSSNRGKISIFQRIYGCRGLYTLLVIDDSGSLYCLDIPDNLSKKLRYLRTLDLSNCGVSQLPESIGKLLHLRYLQLSNTNVKRLPESVGCLYNLQTLGLRNCYALEELPKYTRNLLKLRHLDLHLDIDDSQDHSSTRPRWGSLRSMPPGIGELNDLQTLPRFVVGDPGKRCGLSQLHNLNNLHGELCISNLQLVLNPTEAYGVDLFNKSYLHHLELWWSDCLFATSNLYAERVDQEVLRVLRPHTNLKDLNIVGYKGATFPPWIGDSSFSNLTNVVLSDCTKCEVLPRLGQLPLLKVLYIKGMDGVESVDCAAFCGTGTRFPALQKLYFERMLRLQVWCGDETCELPLLREVVFKDCINLRQITHKRPSLSKLVIQGSRFYVA